jgi:hypothetical protein
MLSRIVDEIYKIEPLVDPVKVVIIFFLIGITRLPGSSRETIGSVQSFRDMGKIEVEGEN